MSTWATLAQARVLWANAPDDDVLLDLLLNAAEEVCVAYASVQLATDVSPVPYRYTQAVVFQARDTWAQQGPSTDLDGILVVHRPMTPTVRSLLRPRPGVPTVA